MSSLVWGMGGPKVIDSSLNIDLVEYMRSIVMDRAGLVKNYIENVPVIR